MALSKFNVLHWHLVDDDTFPMFLQKYPTLSQKASFSASEVYSIQDMKDVVDHAMKLGIRVIPEFDNPGHVRAIGNDPMFKDLVRCFNKDWPSTLPFNGPKINGGPPTGVLDPTYNLTYDLIQAIFDGFNDVFPD